MLSVSLHTSDGVAVLHYMGEGLEKAEGDKEDADKTAQRMYADLGTCAGCVCPFKVDVRVWADAEREADAFYLDGQGIDAGIKAGEWGGKMWNGGGQHEGLDLGGVFTWKGLTVCV